MKLSAANTKVFNLFFLIKIKCMLVIYTTAKRIIQIDNISLDILSKKQKRDKYFSKLVQ